MFARVVFLYLIEYGTEQYYYTNGNRDVLFNGNTYKAVPIKHGDLENNGDEITKSKCELTITNQCAFIEKMLQQYDSFLTTIKVMRYYLSTGDVESEFIGTLSTIEFSVKDASLSFVNILYETQRMAMRLVYQRQCPYALYGSQCRAIKQEHEISTFASHWTRIDNYRLQYSQTLPNNITGGIAELPNGAVNFIRGVDTKNSIITLSQPVYESSLNVENNRFLTLYHGCDRSIGMCQNLFNNSDNYGGFVLLPLDNPTTKNPAGGSNDTISANDLKNYLNEQLGD